MRPLLKTTRENKKESDAYISVTGNLRKHYFLWENTTRANETVCDILKNRYKLPFIYTPSNAKFKNNSSALKNSEFVDESITEMLRGDVLTHFVTQNVNLTF